MPGESALDTALRELAEETGYRTEDAKELVRFFVSPGWCTEELVLFVADDVRPGERSLEDDENIQVVPVDPDEIPSLIQAGEIGDAKTLVGLTTYLGLRLRSDS